MGIHVGHPTPRQRRGAWQEDGEGALGARGTPLGHCCKAMCQACAQRKWLATVSNLQGDPGTHRKTDLLMLGHQWPEQEVSALSVGKNQKEVVCWLGAGVQPETLLTGPTGGGEPGSVGMGGHRQG